MKVKYDKVACNGWFQCVQKWDAFEMNMPKGKAELKNADEVDDGVFVREISETEADAAIAAARSCPVDAIEVYDDDGDLLNHEE